MEQKILTGKKKKKKKKRNERLGEAQALAASHLCIEVRPAGLESQQHPVIAR